MRDLVEAADQRARDILERRRNDLDAGVALLLQRETLSADEFRRCGLDRRRRLNPPMRAMLLDLPGAPLRPGEPAPTRCRDRASCASGSPPPAVCRTDLHVVDGELPPGPLPIIPGHEIVGRVDAIGTGVTGFELGQRVGVDSSAVGLRALPLLPGGPREPVRRPALHGLHAMAATPPMRWRTRYTFPLGEAGDDLATAPLLCAGLISWRSLQMAGDGRRLGIYGFGAAGHHPRCCR